MNGATELVDSSMSSPKRSRVARTGSSHHFLLWRRKSQNSRKKPSPSSWAARSNSLPGCVLMDVLKGSKLSEITAHAGRGRLFGPVTLPVRPGAATQRVAPRQAQDRPERCDDTVVHESQH